MTRPREIGYDWLRLKSNPTKDRLLIILANRQQYNMKKYIIQKIPGNICPKCSKPMQRRIHSEITNKILNQPYFYSQWDVCRPCHHIQHYEEFKVITRENENLIKEAEERNNLFDNL
jgi:uncharacterized protein with PIN domain